MFTHKNKIFVDDGSHEQGLLVILVLINIFQSTIKSLQQKPKTNDLALLYSRIPIWVVVADDRDAKVAALTSPHKSVDISTYLLVILMYIPCDNTGKCSDSIPPITLNG